MPSSPFILSQYLVPQRALSSLLGWLAERRHPALKNWAVRRFVQRYRVDLSEAEHPQPEDYPTFNAFFTRALKPGARPLDANPRHLVSPADGAVSQAGRLEGGRILQAKGRDYTAFELLGGDEALAARFMDGKFATIYLSPRDYHRVHMPIEGVLRETRYVPGDLFSVNTATAQGVPNLFARNERLVCCFDTAAGPMALVLVGAMIVGSMETVWGGVVPRQRGRQVVQQVFPASGPGSVTLARGAELGRFRLGSTVILTFAPGQVEWLDGITEGAPLRMGQGLARQR